MLRTEFVVRIGVDYVEWIAAVYASGIVSGDYESHGPADQGGGWLRSGCCRGERDDECKSLVVYVLGDDSREPVFRTDADSGSVAAVCEVKGSSNEWRDKGE